MKKVTIIGGGNLGSAIAAGLLRSGYIQAGDLTITKRNLETLNNFASQGAQVTSNNADAVRTADIVILAVKPYQVDAILQNIRFRDQQIVISTVTGVWLKQLKENIKINVRLFRAMPNTAIAIGESMTCICSEQQDDTAINIVNELFDHLGKSIVIEESLMDAATVLGACGTAFAMRYIRASIQGGIEIGFNADQASAIVAQTAKGSAELLLKLKSHPEQEIDKVTTPKGCTIAGLNQMEHHGFSSSIIKGLVASHEKIVK